MHLSSQRDNLLSVTKFLGSFYFRDFFHLQEGISYNAKRLYGPENGKQAILADGLSETVILQSVSEAGEESMIWLKRKVDLFLRHLKEKGAEL